MAAAARARPRPRGVRSMVRLQLPPGARASRWPASSSRTAGSARSGTSGRSTCRTGSSTRSSRWSGGCRRTRPGSGALGDIGAHIIDLAQFVTGRADHRGQRADRDVRQASARCPATSARPVGRRRAAAAPGDGHGRRRRAVHRPGSTAARSATFEATRFATGRKNALRVEVNGSRGQPRLRLRGDERAAVLRRHGADADEPGFSRDPGHRARPTRTWRPGGRRGTRSATSTRSPTRCATSSTAIAAGADPTPSFADGLQVQRVLAAVEASARSRRAAGPPSRVPTRRAGPDGPRPRHSRGADDDTTDHACSPASGPTCRSRRCAGWPPSGATTGWRSPAGATTSRSTAPLADDAYVADRKRDLLDKHGLKVWAISNHLVGQAGLRRPDRRAAPGHPAAADLGRRRPRGRAAAGGGGDEGHRAGGRAARVSTSWSASPARRSGTRWRCSRRCRRR